MLSFQDSDVKYIPCSGITGVNLTRSAETDELSSWYKGPCLVDRIGLLVKKEIHYLVHVYALISTFVCVSVC